MPVLYGGIDLTPAPFALQAVERWWHVHRIIEAESTAFNQNGISHLPLPAAPASEPPRIGVLHWPNGASRWATCHLLATGDQLARLRLVAGSPLDLVFSDGTTSVTAPMYSLPARPVSQRGDGRELYLLTLVDERYYWTGAVADLKDTPPATWADLLSDLFAAATVTTPTISTPASAYLTPITDRWAVRYQPVPPTIDAAARLCGLRLVRSLSGDVAVADYATAAAADLGQWNQYQYEVLAGGRATTSEVGRFVPATVSVTFDGPTPATEVRTLTDLALSEFGPATGQADQAGLWVADPLSGAGNSAYADQAATDFYLWQLSLTDATFRGVVPWAPTGLEDCVEWATGETDVVTRVVARPRADANVYGGHVPAPGVAASAWKVPPVLAATTTGLPACTYANGSGGVGATLTANSNGYIANQDGNVLSVGNALLVKDQGGAAQQNGIYTVTDTGSVSTKWVLTRRADADTAAELQGAAVYVSQGATNRTTAWVCNSSNGSLVMGSTSWLWTNVAGVTSSTGGTDNALARYDGTSGNRIKVSGIIADAGNNVTGMGTLNTRTIANWVDGPSSATDNALTRFDGTSGKLVQNSSAALSDAGLLTTADVYATASVSTVNVVATADVFVGNTGPGNYSIDIDGGAAGIFGHLPSIYMLGDSTARLRVPGDNGFGLAGGLTVAIGHVSDTSTTQYGELTVFGKGYAVARTVGISTGYYHGQDGFLGPGASASGGIITSLGSGSFGTVTDGSGGTTGLTLTGSTTLTLGGTLVVANGGTGATDASGARTNLGLVIGTDVQAYDATLAAVVAGTYTGSASIATLGTVTAGTWNGTTIGVANGGTGATDASTARTNLGLVIGTDVQAYDATLAAVVAGTYTGSASIATLGTVTAGTWNGTTIGVANGGTGATDASGARTNLGLGTASTLDSDDDPALGTDLATRLPTQHAVKAYVDASLIGSLLAANNLSDLSSASTARTNLGGTTVGQALFALTDPSAVTFLRINADNSVTARSAANFRSDIGAGTGSGAVTSVGLTMPTGFSVTGGPVTSSGTLAVTITGEIDFAGYAVLGGDDGAGSGRLQLYDAVNATYQNLDAGDGCLMAGSDFIVAGSLIASGGLGTSTGNIQTTSGQFTGPGVGLTGTASGLTAGHVTTNANLTGPITSVGNATSVASQTGTGTKFVMDTSPTLVAPTLGAASATTVNKITITAPATGATLTIDNGVTLRATGNVTALSGSHTGTSSGTNTGDQSSVSGSSGSCTGNAATATALATGRTINGVTFDGTANVTVPAAAGTLTGTALASGVVTSALTTVGTIVTGVWNGTSVTSAYGGTGNGFTKFSGPAATEKTFALPNASATILTDNAVVTSAQGGTGVNNGGRTLTIGANSGTISFTSAVTLTVAAAASVSGTNSGDQTTGGTTNQVSVASGSGNPVISLAGPHNFTTLTAHGVLLGNATGAIAASGAGAAGQVFTSGGASADGAYADVITKTAGESALGTDFLLNSTAAGTYTGSGLTVTLPAAGTYLVYANLTAQFTPSTGSSWYVSTKFRNTTDGADVANTEGVIFYTQDSARTYIACRAIVRQVTVTASKAIEVFAKKDGTSATFVDARLTASTTGPAVLGYVRLY